MGFPDSSVGKKSACNEGDLGSIPGSGRSPGEGKGYPLQYSSLENSMDCSPWSHRVGHDWVTFTFTFSLTTHVGLSFTGPLSIVVLPKFQSVSPTLSLKVHYPPADGSTAATAKLLQSCPTLCDPIDGSPTGSPVPGILQARILEWVAMALSNALKWKVKEVAQSCLTLSNPMDCSLPGSTAGK